MLALIYPLISTDYSVVCHITVVKTKALAQIVSLAGRDFTPSNGINLVWTYSSQ